MAQNLTLRRRFSRFNISIANIIINDDYLHLLPYSVEIKKAELSRAAYDKYVNIIQSRCEETAQLTE